VITVSEMLKIDNAQALQRAQEEAVKSGILQGKQGSAKVEVPLPVWTVRSIYGGAQQQRCRLTDGCERYGSGQSGANS
jgi:hypothetical protein